MGHARCLSVNQMKQSPSREVTSCSGNQEVSRVLCKPIIGSTRAYSRAKHELGPQPPIVIKIHFKIIVQLQLGLPINRFP